MVKGYLVAFRLVELSLGKCFDWETIWVCLATILSVGLLILFLNIGAKNPNV